jgi:hypothetical protein
MIRIIYKGTKTRKGKYTVVCTSKQICPFSWGKYIVLSENDYRQNPDEILAHEEVHTLKRHSLDLLFAEFFILLHWFNPVAWLLKRELQDIHEYEADSGVINQGIDATKYQLILIKKAVGASSYAIANSFNHSKIKNRITMMLKRKSTRWARLKLLLFAPLAVVLLQAFARPDVVGIQESLINSEVTTIFEEAKQPEEKPDVQQQGKLPESQKVLSERQKESTVQQKPISTLQNDTLQNNQQANKIELKCDNIVLHGLPESTKKIIIKGTAVLIDGENETILKGDSIEINLDSFQIMNGQRYSYDSKMAQRLKELLKQEEQQQSQIEKRQEERLKQTEKRQEQIEKRQKERIKQVEQRVKKFQKSAEKRNKELAKISENRKKQAEQRLKEQQKKIIERKKQIEKMQKERLKQSEQQAKES